jgi:hypothetical protein
MIQSGKSLLSSCVVCLLTLLGASSASAQVIPAWTDRGFFNVNIGTQPDERQTAGRGTAPLHGGTASFEWALPVESGGIFDVSGGWRVWRNAAVGVAFSSFSDTSETTVRATIPDPLIVDTPHTDTRTFTGLEHKERGVHLSILYVVPVRWIPRLQASISAGPSFFSVSKDIVSAVTFTEGETTIGTATTTSLDESATGGHVGLDLSYAVLENVQGIRGIGAGFFVRYAKATVDAAGIDGGSFDVGGVHVGGGLRVRF